jgi:cellulose synthase/poly-beta-1,6-N-acetylglucosamine synthase-like glycosyltransferase
MWTITLISSLVLYWIYDGYGRFLSICVRLKPRRASEDLMLRETPQGSSPPTITVLLTVHNEASVIRSRIENLLRCDYPSECLTILVASDGSTDDTNQIVRTFHNDRVQLFESPGLGKTATQNAAIRNIQSDLIVFTDADIQFDPQWLNHVVRRFADPRVGAVDGRLLYGHAAANAVQSTQGAYWNYEVRLRDLESRLGILAVVAGACLAIRRSLFVPMDPAIGEDCIVPLDIVSQGFLVVHEPQAIAHNAFETDTATTLRRRIRMTLRNWQGTWTRCHLLNPFRHPGYAFALWSHKLLRWLSPVFLGSASFSAMAGLIQYQDVVSLAIFLPFAGLFLLAACGWLSSRRQIHLPAAGAAYVFLLANTAFLIGIWRAVTGHRIHSYRNT